MKMVFVSNYFNHHQKPFCEELYQKLGRDFTFISTGMMRPERIKLGYAQNEVPDYVHLAYTDAQKHEAAMTMIRNADVVIAGAAPEEYIAERLRMKKLVLRYAERPFKKNPSLLRRLYHGICFRRRDMGNRRVYMLCAGAYAARDYASVGMYKNRMLKWGYFPAVEAYDPDELCGRKNRNAIVWCGRFIYWKHPDDAIEVARRLKESGFDFQLTMIGTGEMEDELKHRTEEYGLTDIVHFSGSMPPERVRTYMEEAGIYLFTSDRKEGWGAVLNEAMSSGCAVVASDAAGATTFLIRDGENGMVYNSGDVDMLCERVQHLLRQPAEQKRYGNMAYRTIADVWNGKAASERLLQFLEKILQEENWADLFEDGPCSRAL